MSNVELKLTDRSDFLWGVNTHHDWYSIYSDKNVEEQMHLMAEMGVKLLRTGIGEWAWTDKVVRLANEYGIKLMICDGVVRLENAEYNAEEQYKRAEFIANRYNGKNGYGKIDFIQIDNEIDCYLMTRSEKASLKPADGIRTDEYVKADIEEVCRRFANYAAGIRATDSDIKIIINSSWLHYGFYDWLKEYNVDFDIIGIDWYTDMSVTLKARGKREFEHAEFLYERYGKEIIICETNQWHDGDFDETTERSWDDEIDLLVDAYRYPYVLGACVYELCDETYFQPENGPYNREAHFGLIKADRDGNMLEPKPIYYRLQRLYGGKKTNKINYKDL